MSLSNQKYLRITLFVVFLDYFFVGLMEIFFPQWFGSIALQTSLYEISIALFALSIFRNIQKSSDFLVVLIFNEILVIFASFYGILYSNADINIVGTVGIIHLIYFILLFLFCDKSVFSNFLKKTNP